MLRCDYADYAGCSGRIFAQLDEKEGIVFADIGESTFRQRDWADGRSQTSRLSTLRVPTSP